MLKRIVAMLSLLALFCATASAQSVRRQVTSLSAKYKNEKGVISMICDSGIALGSVKMMLRKGFGRAFADNITAFAIIYYKDAHTSTRTRLASDIDAITTKMQPIDVKEKMKGKGDADGFIRLTESGEYITDLLILSTSPHPSLIYIEGRFKAEK